MNVIECLINKELLLLATLESAARKLSLEEDIIELHTLPEETKGSFSKNMKARLPTTIYRKGFEYEMNGDASFHCGSKKPSIKADTLGFYWGTNTSLVPDGKTSIAGDKISNWPVEIVFNDLRMWHHEDMLHRRRGDALICDSIQVRWNNSDHHFLNRENGPIVINIHKLKSKAKKGKLSELSIAEYRSIWVKPGSSQRIVEAIVSQVVENLGIDFDPLSLTSCFKDEADEFIFWSEFM